jgi:hypothetical protein
MSSFTALNADNVADVLKTVADNSPLAASNRQNPSLTAIIFASYLFLKLFIYKKSQSRKRSR